MLNLKNDLVSTIVIIKIIRDKLSGGGKYTLHYQSAKRV